MTPERHQQITDLYNRVLAGPREQWPAVLDEACRDDPELRAEVESLLAANDRAGAFLDTPAIDVGARLLSEDTRRVPDQIGRYRILSLLGRGGMGEVYLAEDPSLRRKVAIKLLPAPLVADAQAVVRFEQEARAASSLNHPNIITIHEIGTLDGGRFIAMEFVEGTPLSALAGSPLSVGQLLPIARQLAQALTVAHTAGIVHRDIKPENVMLRPDGYVKLLDFGVARLITAAIGTRDGGPRFATRADVVIGTPRYMAPEQIRGEPATAASDVFALGAVLHELLTGRHVSEGRLTPLSSTEPAQRPLADMIAQMLDPNPAARPRASEVEAALHTVDAPVSAPIANAGARVGDRYRRLVTIGMLAAAAAMAVVVLWDRTAPPANGVASGAPIRFRIEPPANSAFSPSAASLALSPDGKSLAYTASQIDNQAMSLWVHSLDSLSAKQIPSVKTAGQLFWLPDSQSLAFGNTATQFALQVVDLERGSVRPIENARLGSAGVGSASRDGILARLADEAIYHIPVNGGPPVRATALDASRGETVHSFPTFLPDGRHFLFLATSAQPQHDSMAYIGVLGSTERRPLFKSDSQVVYAHPGFLLYMLADSLLARPFDVATLRVTGESRAIADQVERNSGSRRGAFTVSQTGVLAYRQLGETQLNWYDRTGRRLQALGRPGHYRNHALSPDEKTIAVGRLDPEIGTWDIWTIDAANGVAGRVTTDPSSDDMPVWSPDGSELAFKSDRRMAGVGVKIYRQRPGAGGAADMLVNLAVANTTIHAWTRDGVLFAAGVLDLWRQPASGEPVPLIESPFWEASAQPSPDGRWLAYTSNETGAFEVYVTGLSADQRKTLISMGGGTEPMWRKDGRELFYLSGDRQLMAVPVKEGLAFERGRPEVLFQPSVSALVNSSYTRNQYVVSGDGQRFLINEPTGKGSLAAITVVVNWPATLTSR